MKRQYRVGRKYLQAAFDKGSIFTKHKALRQRSWSHALLYTESHFQLQQRDSQEQKGGGRTPGLGVRQRRELKGRRLESDRSNNLK